MNIEEVKRRRQKLEIEISELINAFQKETGFTVDSLGLEHLLTDAEMAPINTRVKAEVRLGY